MSQNSQEVFSTHTQTNKKGKTDLHLSLALFFFDKPHMVGLANSWWRISYLPTDLRPPLSHFFQQRSASEILVANCLRMILCIKWTYFYYFWSCILVSKLHVFPQESKNCDWVSDWFFGISEDAMQGCKYATTYHTKTSLNFHVLQFSYGI